MVTHAKKLGYRVFFRSWHEDDEYTLNPPPTWEPEGHEHYFQDMKSRYHLSDSQLFWYYTKLMEFRGDLRTMQQEYPSSLEECFQATGGSVYGLVDGYENLNWQWGLSPEGVRCEYLPGHPRKDAHYIIGADPSGGTGNDEAAIQIVCLETFEQVFEFGLDTIDPIDFAHLLSKIGKRFNEAYIVCEGNNHGIATLAVLKKEYNLQKLFKMNIPHKSGKIRYGFTNNEMSKHLMIGASKEMLEQGFKIYGKDTIQQMRLFTEDPKTGKMGGPEDGKVIALCLACIGVKKFAQWINWEPPPERRVISMPVGMSMTFDEIFKKKVDPTRLYGMPRQIH
jgi:hypothetical protein